MTILRFDSVAEFLEASKKSSTWDQIEGCSSTQWDLNVRGPEARKRALSGDIEIASKAMKALENLDIECDETLKLAFMPSVAGSRVCVPAYLAGNPMCMRQRKRTEQVTRHVSVYVDMTCSAGIDASVMLKRGITILGFLEQLQRNQVGVDLFLMCCTNGGDDGDLFQVIRVESKPLDISSAAFALAHPSFSRNVCYGHAEKYGFYGAWPRSYHAMGTEQYRNYLRKVTEMLPTDVLVPEVYLTDTIVKEPTRWIAERINQVKAAS